MSEPTAESIEKKHNQLFHDLKSYPLVVLVGFLRAGPLSLLRLCIL